MPLIGSKPRPFAGATPPSCLLAGALLLPVLLSGCDAAATAPTEYSAASGSASLSLSLQTVDLYPGDTLRVSAGDVNANWTSADVNVAVVSSVGLVTAKQPGQTEVRAETRRGHGSTKVRVREKKSGINVSPRTAVLESVPATLQLTAYRFPNGSADGAVWESLHPEVATVDGMGRVVSKAAGVALITATLGGAADTAKVHVEPTPPPAVPAPSTPSGPEVAPELPRVYLESAMPTGIRDTIRVRSGGSLQSALNSAASKESAVVLLAPGSYNGKLTLPARNGSGWVVITSDAPLPPEGTRVTPANAAGFARVVIRDRGDWGIQAVPGATRYRLSGIEVTADPSLTTSRPMVELVTGSDFITIDRAYLHGHPGLVFQRCVMLNGNSVAIVDSYISECHHNGLDSQAISGWDSDGPTKIVNNYLEGATENLIFGGSGTSVDGRVASDIEIRGNYLHKPLAWKDVWFVKNLFELKNAQRVLFEGNVLDGNWVDGQVGFAVQLTPRNPNGEAPGATVRDVTFRWNIIRDSPGGINILWKDNHYPTDQAERIAITDNLIEVGLDERYGTMGRSIQVLDNVRNLTVARNTIHARHSGLFLSAADVPIEGLRYESNLVGPTAYGIFGGGTGEKVGTWSTHTKGGYAFSGNALVGRESNRYPNTDRNDFPELLAVYAGPAGVDRTRLGAKTSNTIAP